MIDPGPHLEGHVRSLASAVAGADEVRILLTHGHADHAGAARGVASAVGVEVCGPAGVPDLDREIGEGDEIETDEGVLSALHTPGHTGEHLCFLWPERRALFAGDLLLGEGDTTWVADYPGCVGDYLTSLERVRGLGLDVIYPAHGPPLEDPGEAIDRFEGHRRARIRQVEDALTAEPDATLDELLEIVYGDALPAGMEGAAKKSLGALLKHVRG